ncbi:hypothetical protein SAMN02910323_1463 [Selenomonas ruminantium]|uniref:Uncharacterized protein n=2 Tax=Selenomonas ruminantium TaxID=971 RepID=A0A1K1NLB5_SELRU|nr:hypothetical protein SAMN02910323_1463 [Selenomonas ruminantium]
MKVAEVLRGLSDASHDFLVQDWSDVSARLMQELQGQGFAEIQLLGDVWACGAGELFQSADAGGSFAHRQAWLMAVQRMRTAFMSEDEIKSGLDMLADALDWPEEDRQAPADAQEGPALETSQNFATEEHQAVESRLIELAENEEMYEPVEENVSVALEGHPVYGASEVLGIEERLDREIVSLEAWAELQQRRLQSGLGTLQLPLHIMVSGGEEKIWQTFVNSVAEKCAARGLLDSSEIWESLPPEGQRVVWHIRTNVIPDEQLYNLAELLQAGICLAVMTGSSAEVNRILDICAPLRYMFGRRVDLGREGKVATDEY